MADSKGVTNAKPDDIRTLSQIADYLKVSKRTIQRMVGKGELPAAKVGSQWRFQQSAIDALLTMRLQATSSSRLTDVIDTKKGTLYRITDLITTNRVVMDLQPAPKEAILRQLVEPLVEDGTVSNAEEYLGQLLERETMVSTAIEKGVAFPHVRTPERLAPRRTAMVLGLCPMGTDFDSLDGMTTHIFMLICAADLEAHLRLLAKATLMLRIPRMRKTLREANSSEEVQKLLIRTQTDLSIRL